MDRLDNSPELHSDADSATKRSVPEDPNLGIVLNDLYEINELIGVGAWGRVYKAKHLTVDTDVAVKIFHILHLQNESNLKRFVREAKLLTPIESPNLVRVIDAEISPVPYIVMEYFNGVLLSKWLKANGRMDSKQALDFFSQMCRGISALESHNIVHRDLSPDNILLRIYGSIVEAKILDFGLAKLLDQSAEDKITATGEILGSLPYMSPEQWKGQCDNRSDIYALGCIMYEVLAGRPVFSARYGPDYMQKHLTEIPKGFAEVIANVRIPAGLEHIVFKCMEKSPEKRYQSSDLCRQDLKYVIAGDPPPSIVNAQQNKKSAKTKWIVVTTAVLLAVLVSAYLFRESIANLFSGH